ANAGSLPAPKVHFSGTLNSSRSISFNEDSSPELTLTSNWAFNDSTTTMSVGNTPTNAAWISSLRSRADGSGLAGIQPDTLNGGVTGPIIITYRPDTAYAVTDLRIIIPTSFGWSRSPSDVSFTNMTATNTVSGDTVYFTNVTFAADSTVITLANMTSSENTSIYPFRVQSRVNFFADVSPIPRIVVFGLPIPIAEAKANDSLGVPLLLNSLITVRGVVTVANEFGGPSYIQDNSGGFAIFGSSFSTSVALGDEVVVSGLVQPFSGLSEIVNPILHSILSTGNTVEPLVATANQIFSDGVGGLEVYEGRLVRINNATVTGGGTWTAGTNYPLNDPSGSTQLRVDNNTNLVGAPIPPGAFDVVGVVGQFVTAPPYIGGYQLMPRSLSDIISSGPIFTEEPPPWSSVFWVTIQCKRTTQLR
ncbi:MAG: hypothetical protein HW407_1450, partial [Bacteroidetes bacterium]|nr:hypothetical protein [Bacteroidota bacterium]